MPLSPPAGATLVRVVGAGSVFQVGLVAYGAGHCICKRLTPRMRHEPRAVEAAEREVQFLSRVRHPAVPILVLHGSDDHGPFILQSQAPGQSLASLVARGPLPPALLTEVARAALGALADIHAGPDTVALGDLAPDDLFIGRQRGAVVFVDFGQASWNGRPPPPEERGTLPFAPPEVARGEARWSQASDVYALAALLLYGAIGKEPCDTSGPARLGEVAERGLTTHLLSTTELPTSAQRMLRHALAFSAEDRQSDPRSLLDLLDSAR